MSSRVRIKQVIFKVLESAPGRGLNAAPSIRVEASPGLRLEYDELGVIATVLDKDGKPVQTDENPSRYPWGVIRKVMGEPILGEPAPAKAKPAAVTS